jgi:hypothetical protein
MSSLFPETQRLVESAGRRCLLVSGDIKDPGHCRDVIAQAAEVVNADSPSPQLLAMPRPRVPSRISAADLRNFLPSVAFASIVSRPARFGPR